MSSSKIADICWLVGWYTITKSEILFDLERFDTTDNNDRSDTSDCRDSSKGLFIYDVIFQRGGRMGVIENNFFCNICDVKQGGSS